MELTAFEDDQVVDDLLAIVDVLYAPHVGTASRHERGRRAVAKRQALRLQIEQLQRTLDAMRQDLGAADSSVDVANLWGRVAMHQREQREAVAQENEHLKRVVRCQRSRARRASLIVEKLLSLLREAMPRTSLVSRPGPSSTIPTLFVRRLDVVCDHLVSRNVQVTSCATREHEIQWNDARTVLRFRFRSRCQYPFKLSSIAEEMWRMIHEQAPSRSPPQDEVYYADTLYQMSKPFGCFEVQGPSALRRVYTKNGGVVLSSVSILTGTKGGGNDNLMAGLEMHQTIWGQLVRTDASNPKSPVYVESVTELEVFATPDHSGGDSRCGHSRLKRFRDFLDTFAVEERGEGRQKLENRLLDASLSCGRAESLL